MHLPRSVFSHRQLDLFLWLLKVNDVNDVPSVKSMAKLNSLLQKICGVESIPYKGALGHSYYVNNLGQIIGQVGLILMNFMLPNINYFYRRWPIPKSAPSFSSTPRTVEGGSRRVDKVGGGFMRYLMTRLRQWLVLALRITTFMNLLCSEMDLVLYLCDGLKKMELFMRNVGVWKLLLTTRARGGEYTKAKITLSLKRSF